ECVPRDAGALGVVVRQRRRSRRHGRVPRAAPTRVAGGLAVAVVPARVNEASEAYQANRAAMLAQLVKHDEQLAIVNAGGGEQYVQRHRGRGKMLARERLEAMLDQDSPFLELSPLAAWGTNYPVGASLITGIGVCEGV